MKTTLWPISHRDGVSLKDACKQVVYSCKWRVGSVNPPLDERTKACRHDSRNQERADLWPVMGAMSCEYCPPCNSKYCWPHHSLGVASCYLTLTFIQIAGNTFSIRRRMMSISIGLQSAEVTTWPLQSPSHPRHVSHRLLAFHHALAARKYERGKVGGRNRRSKKSRCWHKV